LFSGRSHVRPSSRSRWSVVAGVACAAALAVTPAAAQFVSQPSSSRHVLEGNWQSCQEPPGGPYAERVYDHVVNGVGQFEVHLGPRREFAIFPGVQDEHRDHLSPDNLLRPFRVPLVDGTRAHQRWEIPSLNLVFTVTLGGGGRTDCESWYILLEPLKPASQ
jgi:hypothetical protein